MPQAISERLRLYPEATLGWLAKLSKIWLLILKSKCITKKRWYGWRNMRVFITGPLGYIGQPVAEAFSAAGHQLLGLVRSEEKAEKLRLEGIEPVLGDLSQPDTYMHVVEQAEVILHTAFDNSPAAAEIDAAFVDAVLEACGRRQYAKAFIYTSGVWVLGSTGAYIADESYPGRPIELVKWRAACETKILRCANNFFRTLVVRPGCVYGGPGSLTALWFSSTLRGFVEIAGDGRNHWSMIHQKDLARAYLLAVERELSGMVLNVVDNSHCTVLEMAQAVSEAAGIPGKIELTAEADARKKYGEIAEGLLIDQHISNERCRRLLGWNPQQRSFIDGITTNYLAWKAAQSRHL